MAKITYTSISDADKLLIAKDRLRGLEADHYRLVMTGDADGVATEDVQKRQDVLEIQIPAVQAEVAALEAAIEKPA